MKKKNDTNIIIIIHKYFNNKGFNIGNIDIINFKTYVPPDKTLPRLRSFSKNSSMVIVGRL